MKLFLTSSGITNETVKSILREELEGVKDPRFAVLYTIKDPGDEKWLPSYEKELNDLNVKYDFINISENNDLSDKTFYDGYYVAGGNTFYILDRLRKTGMDKVIINSIHNNKLYIGLSAGSIIAGPDIEIAGFGPNGDQNDTTLKNLESFNLVPFYIYPHYSTSEEEVIKSFFQIKNIPIIAIADGQAIRITDESLTILGDGPGFKLG